MYRLPPRPSPSARRKAPTWNLRLPSSTTVPRHTRAISSSLPTSPRGAPPARSKYQARGCPHAQGYLPFKSASPSVNGCSDLDARHLGHAELARRQHAAVAGDDAALAVDQHRIGEPKLADAAGDLRDLGVAVDPRVARVGDQRLDRAQHDLVGHLHLRALFYETGKSRAAGVYTAGPGCSKSGGFLGFGCITRRGRGPRIGPISRSATGRRLTEPDGTPRS